MISTRWLAALVLGVSVSAFAATPGDEAAELLGIQGTTDVYEGFRVTAVKPYSPAAKAGIRAKDDSIIAVNGKPVTSESDLNLALRQRNSSKILITMMHQYWRVETTILLP